MKIRRAVAQFVRLMENKLQKHDDAKGREGWKVIGLPRLIHNLRSDCWDLEESAYTLHAAIDASAGEEELRRRRVAVALAAADVANWAMMIADRVGGLPELPGELEIDR